MNTHTHAPLLSPPCAASASPLARASSGVAVVAAKAYAGIVAANQALADRRHFVLSEEQWEAFQQALDAPPQPMPRLKKLMTEPSILD